MMYHSFTNENLFGVGVDMTDIRRFQKLTAETAERLAKKILTEYELQQYQNAADPIKYLAVSYCAKEAVSKSFGTGFRKFWFTDIEIRKNKLNKPNVYLSENIISLFHLHQSNFSIELSISHEIPYIISFCVAIN